MNPLASVGMNAQFVVKSVAVPAGATSITTSMPVPGPGSRLGILVDGTNDRPLGGAAMVSVNRIGTSSGATP
jgi:hypothetical protein